MTQVQWFPGHMAKTRRLIQEQLKLVDVVIELVDARLPMSSRNPLIDELVAERKPRIVILNKEDLADPQRTKYWINHFNEQQQCRAIAFNATVGKKVLISQLKEALKTLTAEKRARMEKKGIKRQAIRCMVVGIPNVGKSTFINILVGKKSAKTGDKPGVTRGTQWIRLEDDIELLDTPGILWPKFDDEVVGFRLAASGAISDEVFSLDDVAYQLIVFLQKQYPRVLAERYKLTEEQLSEEAAAIMEAIGANRGFLLKGGAIDYTKTARILITEFRNGKLGRITLE